MTSSGTYNYSPAIADFLIEAFERCGVRASEITPDHMFSAKRSINLVLASWGNLGVNLWEVDLQTVPLYQGISTYTVPSSTIMILDGYIRTYPMGAPVDLTPAFATTSSSTTVTVTQTAHGLSVGNYINIIMPVSIGGIILLAYYQVVSVIDSNNYTITASAAASSTSGGVVPFFSTTASSSAITVTLPNHGYLAGQSFVVQVATTVGGLTFSGTYTIASVPTANTFTFTNSNAAGSTATGYENDGDAQIAGQQVTAQPIDRVIGPMSRTDYNSLPNKIQQGFPTIYWYDRLINQTITLWQVPDGNGPYQLQYYRMRQIQDANPVSGQTIDLPNRFFEAFCAGTAFHLSMKWAPDRSVALKAYYDIIWAEAAKEDRELVPFRIQPDISGYFQG